MGLTKPCIIIHTVDICRVKKFFFFEGVFLYLSKNIYIFSVQKQRYQFTLMYLFIYPIYIFYIILTTFHPSHFISSIYLPIPHQLFHLSSYLPSTLPPPLLYLSLPPFLPDVWPSQSTIFWAVFLQLELYNT